MATKVTTPFPVSGYLGPAYFCNRQEETQELLSALGGGRNVTLFSLRRMGKTALIRHLFHKLSTEKAYQTLYVDIMPTSDLKGFINQLATALVQTFPENTSLGKKMWQWIKSLRPQVSFDPFSGLPQLSLDMVRAGEQQATIRSLFNFLDDSGKKSVIAIDEFQQITRYPEISTEAWLRSEIQSLKNVNFIFCGSQKHLLLEMFNSAKRPFYASTQMLPISTIGKDAYAKFITNHFKKSGTTIDAVEVDYILDWTRQHTFYVQSICNRLYQVGSRKITKETIQSVIEKIFKENEAVYFTFRELLTGPQWALLKAIAKEGRVFAPTAMAFIQQYDLGSPATVKRSLESLLDKEMIFRESDIEGSYLQVYDLFLSRWLEYNQ